MLFLRTMPELDIKDFSENELIEFVIEQGGKKFRAEQVAHWLYNHGVENWEQMKNVPQKLRDHLATVSRVSSLEEANREMSSDGTVKWAFRTLDGHLIESVLIPSESRNSICISTQVGCAMGCTFCRTGTMGLKRHLTPGEITEQFIRVRNFVKEFGSGELTNIIFMGMGEPLHNYKYLATALGWFHHQKYFNLSRRRMTVSTSGLIEKIKLLADENQPVSLAISLNGSNDEMRRSIMPINKRYPIAKLMDTVDYYIQKTGNGVTFEYVLIKDLTCTAEAAKDLVKLIRSRNCKVNAIALNASDDPKLVTPDPAEIEEFLTIVRQSKKHVSMRQPRGRDIKAACGQLATEQQKVT